MIRRFRRALAPAALAAAAPLLLVACGGGDTASSAGSSAVVFAGHGGAGQDGMTSAWFEPFAAAQDTTVTYDSPLDYARLQQMVESDSVQWDVIDSAMDFPGGAEANPLLSDIDCTVVACDDFTGDHSAHTQAVPSYIYSYALAYNTDDYSEAQAPVGVDALWDTTNYPGPRAVDGSYGFYGLIEAALVHDGVPRDQLYPLDVDRAFRVLDSIKDDLVFYNDAESCVNQVASGDVTLGLCYNGRITLGAENGLPVAVAWGKQLQDSAYLMIPSNNPNPEAAQALVAYITSPEHNGEISNYLPYSPANPQAQATGHYAGQTPTDNELEGDQAPISIDGEWWGENSASMYERVAQWQAS